MKNIEVSVDLLEANEAHQAGKDPFSVEGKAIPNDDGEEPPKQPDDWFRLRTFEGCGLSLCRTPKPVEPLLLMPDEKQLFLPKGKTGLIAAAGGSGKTWAICQLAAAVAIGGPWFGFKTKRAGKVLLVLGEETLEEINRRLFWIFQKDNDEDKYTAEQNIYPLSLCGRPEARLCDDDGTPTKFAVQLQKLLNEAGVDWDAILLDPASRLMPPGAESDNGVATGFVTALEQLTMVRGNPSVVCAHHTRKSSRDGSDVGAEDARGSSALIDGVRWAATMKVEREKDPDDKEKKRTRRTGRIILSHQKSNYGRIAEDIFLKHTKDNYGCLESAGGPKKANRDVGES